ncbi:MAG: nucleoside hydrolase [Bryobacterales bacterium]|nr:nucleoside hydrolase [Bryobacterales bacterium]
MQRGLQATPPVGIIFDCDLGNDIDDALALALLYGLDGKMECRVVATTISKPNLNAAALSEVIGRFYAGTVSAAFNAGGRTLPVGLATEGKQREDTPMLTAPLARRTADAKPVYNHGIEKITDTADPINVLRNALSAQHPKNAVLVLAGPASNVVELLRYPASLQLIPEKSRLLVIAAGKYPDGKAEPGIQSDIEAARRVFAEWPTPIVAVGSEVGEAIAFPAASIEADFAWSEAHPVVDAYRAFKPMPYDATTAPMAAVLYAVRSNAGLFSLSEPGTITVLDDGRTKFTPSPTGNHRYLIVDPSQISKIQESYVQLASAKPVPRAPRRRLVVEENPRDLPPAPPAAKPSSGPAQPR